MLKWMAKYTLADINIPGQAAKVKYVCGDVFVREREGGAQLHK